MTYAHQPRGLYFEDFEVGQTFYSTGRTINASDIAAFAGLSGDYNQIHTDAEFAKTTPFGQRVAHGLLITSIASGLVMQSGVLEGTVLAFREINDWRFIKPTFIDDTVHVETEVISTKALRRIGGGSVVIKMTIKNQDDETLIKGTWNVLVVSRPQD